MTPQRRGFSLVEVLVALALLALVLTLASALLQAAARHGEAMLPRPPSSTRLLADALQDDLDWLHRDPLPPGTPSLLLETNTLTLARTRPPPNDPALLERQYRLSDDGTTLLRIDRLPPAPLAETNAVLDRITQFLLEAREGSTWQPSWPSEAVSPPTLLRLHITREGEPPLTRILLCPASFHASPPTLSPNEIPSPSS